MNELLVPMVRFRGLMIATTNRNRLDGFAPACLRRFQVKVRFDYLTDRGKRAPPENTRPSRQGRRAIHFP